MNPSVPKVSLSRWMWAAAVLLMLAEFLVFDRMTSRHHAWIYPRWNDQIQYLTEAYSAYDYMQEHGLLAGLKFALGKEVVQGTLHDTCAIVVFKLAGAASRSAALSLNMLVFLAWQTAVLFAIPRVTGSRALGWMGFGLVLCLAWPWSNEAGSAVDFRLDHGAMCLFGVTSCLALLSEGFRRTGWSLAFGAAMGVMLLERFLTGVYFVPIFAATALWVLLGQNRVMRLRNLLLAGVVATVLTVPVLWHNRVGIYNYYWVGHVGNAESAARLRGFDFGQSVEFVLRNLGLLHLGPWFGWTVAGLTGALVVPLLAGRRQAGSGLQGDWLFWGLATVLLPGLVLVFHPQKSEVVLGILSPGVVLLVLWLWQALWSRIEFRPERRWLRLLPCLPALAALAAGGTYFARCELRSPHHPQFIEGANKVNWLADYIFTKVQARNLTHPSVGVDQIVDFIDGRILRVMCYERHRTWIAFGVHLPDSILAGPDGAVFFKLRDTDFMLLTDQMRGDGHWPYDKQMRRLYPQLKDWCNEHLISVDSFNVFGRDMTLYMRPATPP